jgi:hypothetical protein
MPAPVPMPTRPEPELLQDPRRGPGVRNPYAIGEGDLNPNFGAGLGVMPPGGGMYVGPDHPLFAHRGPHRPGEQQRVLDTMRAGAGKRIGASNLGCCGGRRHGVRPAPTRRSSRCTL